MHKGDRVQYKAEFCRNTGQYTGATPLARGVIQDFAPLGDARLAVVKWTNDYCEELPTRILESNLERCQ